MVLLAALVVLSWSTSRMTGAEARKRRRTYTAEAKPDSSREEGRVRLMLPAVASDYAEVWRVGEGVICT
jgi:tRNA G26 N,N-dimethylase Trm1